MSRLFKNIEGINQNHVNYSQHLFSQADETGDVFLIATALSVKECSQDEVEQEQTSLESAFGVVPWARICQLKLWEAASAGQTALKFAQDAISKAKQDLPTKISESPVSPMTVLKNGLQELKDTVTYYEQPQLMEDPQAVELARTILKAAETSNSKLASINKELSKQFPAKAKIPPRLTEVMSYLIGDSTNQSWTVEDAIKKKK